MNTDADPHRPAGSGGDAAGAAAHHTSLREALHAWRFFFWALGVVLLVGGFYLEENWRARRAWDNYQRDLRARGEVADAAAILPPPAADADNFAATPLLAPLFQFAPGTQRTVNANALSRAQNFAPRYDAAASRMEEHTLLHSNSWVPSRIDLPAWYAAYLEGTNRPAHPGKPQPSAAVTARQAAEGVLAALSEVRPVLDELRLASRRPRSRFNLYYQEENPATILLPHLSVLKHCSQITRLRCSAELAAGETDKAFDDLQLGFALSDALREEPILISHLVRIAQLQIAIQPLAEGMGQWSPEQLRAVQDRLSRIDLLSEARRTLAGERVLLGSGVIDYIRRSRGKLGMIAGLNGNVGEDQGSFNLAGAFYGLAPSGWLYLEELNYSKALEDSAEGAINPEQRRLFPEVVQRSDQEFTKDSGAGLAALLQHRFFLRILLPAISRVTLRSGLAQTELDTAALACALERYRRDHQQFPDSLDALRPNYVAELPHDVINGQPLHYRRTPDGSYVLYSVGWNGTDDGGIVATNKSGKSAENSEGDWVWKPLPP